MNKTLVIIVGGRSGTSMVAKILQILEVDIKGEDTVKSDVKIVPGYMEAHKDSDLDFLLASVKKLQKKEIDYPSSDFEEKIKKLSESRGGKWGIWGWKSTSSLDILPWLVEALENICIIICYRNIKAQAKSVVDWADSVKDVEKQKERSKIFRNRIEEIFKKYPTVSRLNLSFENFFNDTENEVRKICQFFNLPYKEEATKFINPKLKHY